MVSVRPSGARPHTTGDRRRQDRTVPASTSCRATPRLQARPDCQARELLRRGFDDTSADSAGRNDPPHDYREPPAPVRDPVPVSLVTSLPNTPATTTVTTATRSTSPTTTGLTTASGCPRTIFGSKEAVSVANSVFDFRVEDAGLPRCRGDSPGAARGDGYPSCAATALKWSSGWPTGQLRCTTRGAVRPARPRTGPAARRVRPSLGPPTPRTLRRTRALPSLRDLRARGYATGDETLDDQVAWPPPPQARRSPEGDGRCRFVDGVPGRPLQWDERPRPNASTSDAGDTPALPVSGESILRTWPALALQPALLVSLLVLSTACDGGPGVIDETGQWSLVQSGLPGALTSVWGTAADDVWAVGSDPGDGSGPMVLNFDGAVVPARDGPLRRPVVGLWVRRRPDIHGG